MKIAKLHIKGLKEPIQLTETQGQLANEYLRNKQIPDDERIDVGQGKWVGTKRDMRYVTFETVTEPEKPIHERFTTDQLRKFGERKRAYAEFRKSGKTGPNDSWEFYIFCGVMRRGKNGELTTIDSVGYFRLTETERAWESIQARRRFAEQKDVERIEEQDREVEGLSASLANKYEL